MVSVESKCYYDTKKEIIVMKYLANFDFSGTSKQDLAKKVQLYYEAKQKNPDKYPTTTVEVHIIENENKGFAVWEATPEQASRKVEFMLPESRYTLIPIITGKEHLKSIIEGSK
jgi:hypothetical protein